MKCVQAIQRISSGQASEEEVKERQERGMADPEVQRILTGACRRRRRRRRRAPFPPAEARLIWGGGRSVREAVEREGRARALRRPWHAPLSPPLQALIRRTLSPPTLTHPLTHPPTRTHAHTATTTTTAAKNADPIMRQVLSDMQTDPRATAKHMANPGIAAKINKLVAAGIIQTR